MSKYKHCYIVKRCFVLWKIYRKTSKNNKWMNFVTSKSKMDKLKNIMEYLKEDGIISFSPIPDTYYGEVFSARMTKEGRKDIKKKKQFFLAYIFIPLLAILFGLYKIIF